MRSTLFITPLPRSTRNRARPAAYFARAGEFTHQAALFLAIFAFGLIYLLVNAVASCVRIVGACFSRWR